MHIDEIFSVFDTPQDSYEVAIGKEWSQGRTSYGGLTAGLIYKAIENLLVDDRKIRSFHCNFIGPANLGEPVTVSARILRQGKSVTQAVGQIEQNGSVLVMVQACFGHSRESKLAVMDDRRHGMQLPKKAKFIPQIPKLVPKFLQHFDLALERGDLALAGNKESYLDGWSRFKKPPKDMTMAHLITLMDCWPPTMLQMLRLPAMASTMSWNIEFIHPEINLGPEDWMASQCKASHILDGYGHEEANLWDKYGNLIAVSKQVVTIFA